MAASSSTSLYCLLYTCIAYNRTILSEVISATSSASSLGDLANSILLKNYPLNESKTYCYSLGAYQIYLVYSTLSQSQNDTLSGPGSLNKLTFLTITSNLVDQGTPLEFLNSLRSTFLTKYSQKDTNFSRLPTFGCARFNADIRSLMNLYEGRNRDSHIACNRSTPLVDADANALDIDDVFRTAQREIDSTRQLMSENIERVLERGERISLLVDKTYNLDEESRHFQVKTRGLRRRLWLKNVKLLAVYACIGLFAFYLVVGFGCGFPRKY